MILASWWRHQMETRYWPIEGNPPVTSGFPSRPVMRSSSVSFDMRLHKRLSQQSRHLGFETSSRSLWSHSNESQDTELIQTYSGFLILCFNCFNDPTNSVRLICSCNGWFKLRQTQMSLVVLTALLWTRSVTDYVFIDAIYWSMVPTRWLSSVGDNNLLILQMILVILCHKTSVI